MSCEEIEILTGSDLAATRGTYVAILEWRGFFHSLQPIVWFTENGKPEVPISYRFPVGRGGVALVFLKDGLIRHVMPMVLMGGDLELAPDVV